MENPTENLPNQTPDQVQENGDFMDENTLSRETQEITADQGQTLPIFQKIIDLSSKIQELKKAHTVLSDEVKVAMENSFPDPEAADSIRALGTENEIMKKKYIEEIEILKKKYLEECFERKRLYNEVIEFKGNIRVFCRCRPLSPDEIANCSGSVVEFDSSQDKELQIISADSIKKQFKFDHVFRPQDSQGWKSSKQQKVPKKFLDSSRPVFMEQMKCGHYLRVGVEQGLLEQQALMRLAVALTVKGENVVNGQKTQSHLWLVDLAGSERVGRIDVEGERLKESQNSKLTHMLQSSLGGDCKTLMFVQISPCGADLGETLCSLNFASRVRGIEHGPARKQADYSELLKYKQMAEKLKHDEKETKKLQDSLQSFQLRLAAREHMCRNLQEKVRNLENQLAEEKRTRMKQEARAAAAASTTSQKQMQRAMMEKKPPLVPSRTRQPLRRISNFFPPPSPVPLRKGRVAGSLLPALSDDKENAAPRASAAVALANNLLKPRRASIAVKPPTATAATTSTVQVFKPKRRVSIATLFPEPRSSYSIPQVGASAARFRNNGLMGRQSLLRDPCKARRTSRLFSPLLERKTVAASPVEATPIGIRSSSKFMGSPPSQAPGSWRPKHPTVIALQRKSLVWSPLKMKSMKNFRNSLLPC
ncbi:Spindle pole body-associated protein Vik1/Cik1, microtubule binding domain [Dillenia turbinata]|uniref:Kinesin-like protein n=1 Tax=Dillenia turbinata TaxID=194707 RepID=A0AAN8YUE4_9MAGN